MYHYEILVASIKYRGSESLTYASEQLLSIGQTVLVPLRSGRVSGVVIKKVIKPKFPTKSIISVQIEQPLPPESLQLLAWITQYYPAPASSIVSLFIPSDLRLGVNQQPETLLGNSHGLPTLPPLTDEQAQALTVLQDEKTTLLHGDTGTGKTRIYLEQIRKVLVKGRSALVLTPEIGLTSQLSTFLQENLAQPVVVLHSNLTGAERRKLWQQIQGTNSPLVIVGPRSALFAPVSNIGLIIVDEAHDNAYKQDQSPYYHALRVAGKLAQIHKAQLIFGTATPLVSEYFILDSKKLPIVRLTQIAAGNLEPPVIKVVDARDRTKYSTNNYLSDLLLEGIESNLNKGEQSLVFLNRRGTARVVLCQSCSWQALCPHCDLPLTYHGDTHHMRCHTCGHKGSAPTSCPECGGTDIAYKSIGTKALVQILEKRFPNARIQRFDTDNTKSERLDKHYSAVRSGQVDILVGTQMLVKGLDLPSLSLVGIVAADTSLQFPDYTADEQTYQLLSQVIGRVGRGHRQGFVVIQTHNTSGAALQATLNKNWDEFYAQQLAERKQFMFPPYCHVLQLYCSRKSQAGAIKATKELADKLRTSGLKIDIVGPSPRFNELSRGNYNWQLTIKAKQRSELLAAIELLPSNWTYNLDPTSLL